MFSISLFRYSIALAAIAVSFAACAAQGRLGFSVAVATDGFLSTTLKQVKITAVEPDAPAAQAGLLAGDELESVNEVPVVGTKGAQIMDIVKGTQPGQHLRLKVLRGGSEHLVDIVAGAPK